MSRVRRTSAVFHVLTWKAGEGTSATAAVTPPLSALARHDPITSCLRSLTMSTTATDTLSSPWVDYQTDKAFVGTNDGKIYRISCVFKCAQYQSHGRLDVCPASGWHRRRSGHSQRSGLRLPSGRLFVGDNLANFGSSMSSVNTAPILMRGQSWLVAEAARPLILPAVRARVRDCTANGGSYGIPDSVLMDSAGAAKKFLRFPGMTALRGKCDRGPADDGP